MTDATRDGNARLRSVLLAGAGVGMLGMSTVYAEDSTASPGSSRDSGLEEVYVFGSQDAYKIDTSSLGKLTTPLIDVPQSIDTISEQELQDRAVLDLNQALRTVPGVTIGAGEFKSLGNSPTIRGFVARTDMFLDGIRDYGDYYRDPFNLESIEVLEGPASILFGRGSTGGVIEQGSKLPKLQQVIAATLVGGTNSTRRATVDVNEPVAAFGAGAALRVNLMGHKAQMTDRNDVVTSRWGVAPSLSLGLGTPTRLTFAYYHQYNDDIPDYGIPYFGAQPVAVPRDNFYGFRDDFMKTRTDIGSIKVEHDFSSSFTLQNTVRYASYGRNFRFTEPLIATTIPLSTLLDAVRVTRNDNTGSSVDTLLWDQFFGTLRWEAGGIQNTSVIGVEGGHEKAAPLFENSTGVPSSALLTPDENRNFTATSTYPRYKSHLSANSAAPFLIDTATVGSWDATLGLRWDYFHVDYDDINYSTIVPGQIRTTDQIPHLDEMFSYRAALAYKPLPNGSIYLSFGTSFNPSAEDLSLISSSRSFSLNNANLDPEKNRNYELGSKWSIMQGRLDLSGAIFRAEKSNARVPNPDNILVNILAGSQRVDGAEFRVNGRVTSNWQITAGYTYLDSTVTNTAPGAAPVGSPLMNTPKNAFSFWSVYELSRFELGGGGHFVGSQYTQNVPPIKTVPGYWTFDAMAKYAITPRVAAQVNVNNLTNRYYYEQLHFFHVVPGEGRTALLTLQARF